jgi:hypothetical protein
LVTQLDAHLGTLLAEKDFGVEKIKDDVSKGKLLLEQLTEKLSLRL